MIPSGTAPPTPPVHPGSGDLDGALGSLLDQARDLVGNLDPDTVPTCKATQVWDLCGELARLFTGAQTLVARRVADAGDYKPAGSRDTAEFLALRSGAAKSQMAQMLATSHRLPEQPVTQTAVRQGELSTDQTHAIADAARADPDQQQRLVDYARERSLKELRDETQRTKAAADPTPEATRRRHHDERHFRQGTGADGRWWFKGQGLPEDRARFDAALNPFIETQFHHARQQGRKEPRDALAYDALQTLAHHAHYNLHTTSAPGPGPGPDSQPAKDSVRRNAGPGGDDRLQPDDGEPDHHTNGDVDNPPGDGDPRSGRPGGDTAHPQQPNNGTASHPPSPGDPAASGPQPDTPTEHPDGPAPGERPARDSDPHDAGVGDPDRPQPHDGTQPSERAPNHHTNRDPNNPPSDSDPRSGHPGDNTAQPQPAQHSDATATGPWGPGDAAAGGPQPDDGSPPPEAAEHPDGPALDGSLFGRPVPPKPNSRNGRPKPPAKARRQPNLSLLPVLRLDLAALQRGYLHPGELCEITSNGPLTLTAARELLDESIAKLVLTRHDDVTTVAHLGRTSPTPTQLAILHADATALTPAATGALVDKQTCDVPGIGLVDKSTAQRLLGQLNGTDLLDKVLARGRDVATLTHPGRQPTIAQRTALLWTQPTCSVAGCPHTFTQIDHRHEWHKQNQTELANLDRLCGHHHRLKSHHNYQLIPGAGDRAFVPPEDPRHPDNQSLDAQRDQAPPQAA